MNESYAEASVKRVNTAGTYVIKFLLVFLCILSFLLSAASQILLFVSAILIVACIYFFPRFNVEYEYVFCDGQLDFDKIMGNAKRKTALRIDFENVEVMAPEGSHSLDGYTHVNFKVKNFTSGRKEIKPYVIVTREGEMVNKILFEPDENMIQKIKNKSPRKVAAY